MISVIIPTYNEEKVIGETLLALRSALKAPNYEIIVSDSKSSDKTVAISQKYADKIVIDPEPQRRSIGRGKNLGASAASGEFLVFIDADVHIPEPIPFFERALSHFKTTPNLSALTVFIQVFPARATLADKLFFGLLNWFYVLMNNVLRIGVASGEFQMMRRDVFKNVGGYREDLPAGEDNDIFRRLGEKGKTRIDSGLTILHSGRHAHALGWPRLLYYWIKNGIYIMLFKKSAYKTWEAIR